MARKPALGPASDRTEDGRPARELPDPRQLGPQALGRRVLPQIPHAELKTKIRHTAVPRRPR